ncbi:MAG: hypothetical protein GX219_09270 [Tissierellia bacterium]|nr:hypothetical protein [Tissierellia bacterium]
MNKNTITRIEKESLQLLTDNGYELVELKYEEGRNLVFYLYKEAGMDLDSLESISRKLDTFLEEELKVDESYNLVVSSPDLSRNLHTDGDFRRNLGQVLEIKLRVPIEHNYNLTGTLIEFDENMIKLVEKDNGTEREVSRDEIKRARIYIEI